jgi:polynucleotide 5'-kinase involved in rRNA processing
VLQHARELEPVIDLLAGLCARVHRVAPAAVARDRSREERRAYREGRFRAHLRGARLLRFSARRVIGADWSLGLAPGDTPRPGTLVGLLDAAGFCLRVGLVRRARAGTLEVSARWREPRAVRWLQLGRLRVAPGGEEAR